MRARVAARLGWAIFGLAVLAYLVALTLNLRRPQSAELSETTGDLVFALTFLPYGWLGARIVPRQPHLLMGWLLCAMGLQGGLTSGPSPRCLTGDVPPHEARGGRHHHCLQAMEPGIARLHYLAGQVTPRGCSAGVDAQELLNSIHGATGDGQGEVVGVDGAAHRPSVGHQLGELVVGGRLTVTAA
jgi:hypothetical protein